MQYKFDKKLLKKQKELIYDSYFYDLSIKNYLNINQYLLDLDIINNSLLKRDENIFYPEEDISINYDTTYFDEKIKNFDNFINNDPDFLKYRKIKFSCDDILEFVNNFYNNCFDDNIARMFNSVFHFKDKNVMFYKERSACYYLLSLNFTYFFLEKANNITDLVNAAHEYAHSIEHMIKFHNYTDNPFAEVFSELSEMIALDYSLEYFYNIKDCDVVTEKINTFDAMVSKAILLSDQSKGNRVENYLYVISYLVAIELYFEYLNDKEKCIYKLTSLIDSDKNNYPELLKELDIDIYKNVSNYIKKLT